ncbi:MAG: MBOAT family protein [Alistipes sp.]|nr:MBOAT family protein [Alistipes sp.]
MMDFFKFDGEVWQRLLTLLNYDSASPMTLASGFFLFAFLVFGIGYMAVRNRRMARTIYVSLISLYFYYKISGLFVLLLLFVATSDYLIGQRIAKRRSEGLKTRGWVTLSMIINILILAYFKIGGLFEEALNNLFGNGTINLGEILVPAGVSFFVFQSMSYIIDLSRGVISPVKRYLDYLFLLSFFPKVFLGPLVRNKEFIPQIESENIVVTRDDIGRAVALVSSGLIKYAVISKAIDTLLLIPAVSGDFGDSGVVMLVALYAFGIRLYCDFSGYSDIAIGIAQALGYKLPDNFDAPFKSATITEFWRRWHISLSSWLRDYLYISLGGNRKGRFRTYMNLTITMFVCAMWHKVNLPYVVWGMLQGVGLALHKLWLEKISGSKALGKDMKRGKRILATLLMFNFMTFTWPMICMDTWEGVMDIYTKIFTNFAAGDFIALMHKAGFALVLVVIGYAMHFMPKRFNGVLTGWVTRSGFVGQLLILVVTIWIVMQAQMMLAGDGGLPVYAAF